MFDKANQIRLLERARELLARPYGWTRGAFVRPSHKRGYPSYCLGGAFHKAAEDLELTNRMIPSIAIAEFVLGPALARERFSGVVAFNDTRGRRKKDVLALIDERLAELNPPSAKVPPKK